MINLFLFILSCLYLIAEYFFNVSLVNIVGTDTTQMYVDVDSLGRMISALGAVLLAFRLLLNIKSNKKIKVAIFAIVLPLVYFGVYELQEKLLNYITESTPMEDKRSQSYTYIYKKGISNGALDFKKIPKDTASKSEQHVFNSSVVFWGIGYPDFQNKVINLTGKEIKNDTTKVFAKDFENNLDYYFRSYMPLDEVISGIYRGYTFKQSMIEESRRYAEIDIDKAWDKKIEFEKSLINKYNGIKKNLYKKEKSVLISGVFRKSLTSDIHEVYYFLADCGTQGCYDARIKTLNKFNEYYQVRSRIQKAKGFKIFDYDYRLEKNCKFSNKKGYNSFKMTYLEGHKVKQITRRSRINKFTKYHSIECNVDLRPVQHFQIERMYENLSNKTKILDFSSKNKKEFANSQALSDSISNVVFEEAGISLHKGWNKNDKHAFYEAFKNNHLGDQYGILKAKLKERFGFEVPLGMTKKQFYSYPQIRDFIKEKSGILYINNFEQKGYNNFKLKQYAGYYSEKMYNGFKMGMYEPEVFSKHYKKHMYVSLPDYFIEKMNEDRFINNTFKMTVVPIIAILFSLLFGLINLAMIFKDIICYCGRIKNKKIKHLISLSTVLLLIITPYFINNTYTQHKYFNDSLLPSIKENSVVAGYVYKWFLNTETLVYSTTQYFFIEPKEFMRRGNSMSKEEKK